jgi:cysteine synthase
MNKFKDIKKLFNLAPIIEITYRYNNNIGKVYSSLEWYSLTGSIKDKVAYQIFYDLYKDNKIKERDKIVEVSSGNMGLSICALGSILNNPVTIIMPKSMSTERKKLLKLYGARLILVKDFKEAFALCKKYEDNGYICTHQFENESNFKAHYLFTAKKLYNGIKNKNVTHFIAGVGTSGTLMGCGKFLKDKLNLKVVAIEPYNARILTNKGPFSKHKLQGLADEIVPKLYDNKIIDDIKQIRDEDAIAMSQKLCKNGIGCGISSGANFLGAILSSLSCATIFPDDNKKYLSTDLMKKNKSLLVDSIDIINIKYI